MSKIKGKFAPLTDELGNDERFIIDCTDFEKLIYMLIVYTVHMTRHQAPIDPRFYRHRYGIKARSHQIRTAIDTLLTRFPKLKCVDEKLSLLNSATYESGIFKKSPKKEKENKNKEVEGEGEHPAPSTFLDPKNLLANGLFSGLTQTQKDAICDQYPRQFLERQLSHYIATAEQRKVFRMNPGTVFHWLERDYREAEAVTKVHADKSRTRTRRTEKQDAERIEQWKKEAVPMPEEFKKQLEALGVKSAV